METIEDTCAYLHSLFQPRAITIKELHSVLTHDGKLVKDIINQYHSTLPAPAGWRVAFILTNGW